MLSNPIFIIGTERSGSNLLRLLLDGHSNISIPHPPHLMRDLAPIVRFYGDLSQDAHFRLLVKDSARIVNLHFVPWPFQVSEEALHTRAEERSLYGVYAALYDMYAAFTKKPRWGCKSTFMYQQIETILKHHTHPLFLHLVRDPRDVASSADQSIFSHYHPYKQAALWTAQQQEIEKHADRLRSQGHLLRIKYEDLTAEPELVLAEIMQFLGERLEQAQLEYFKGPEASRLSALSESWENCAQPISKKNVGRFRAELTPKEVRWVELHAHELMRKYGYPPENTDPIQTPSAVELLTIEFEEQTRRIRTEMRSLIKDKNFPLRWKKKIYLHYLQNTRELFHA